MSEVPVSRYRAEIDLGNINDPHVLAVGRVPGGSDVLDLGAADGSVASILSRMRCRVWGVELDPDAAESAREVCEDVVVGDLNQLDLSGCFGADRFDVVLMLDVLEHLVDPASVLRSVGNVLRPGGWGVISIPNIAHISVRLALLQGHFSYTDVGLLDRTHLRFFDAEGVRGLLREAGWAGIEMVRVTRDLGTTEIPVGFGDEAIVAQLLQDVDADEDALTYQFVVMAAPEGSEVFTDPPVLPAAVAQRAVLEAQTWTRIPGLWNELDGIRGASLQRREHLRHLVASLRENSDRIATTLAQLG